MKWMIPSICRRQWCEAQKRGGGGGVNQGVHHGVPCEKDRIKHEPITKETMTSVLSFQPFQSILDF